MRRIFRIMHGTRDFREEEAMTESEKRIREMAEIIEKRRIEASVTAGSFNEGAGMWYAKDLYMKGYRKQSEVVKGIRDKIETQGRFEFCGADGKEYLTIRADKLNEIIKAAEYGVEVEE